ncbi:class I SAM-dependent methyltransferase [Longispora sp. NPDC051575]|uniref:class I SAM-dependent methyltransferase n=1 Tax=Longispora sp. NPDC051575 TaxID=3154943 RepID=UPI0034433E82
MEDASNRTRAVYDKVADQFARLHSHMPPAIVTLADDFARVGGAAGPVLDLGSGAGRDMVFWEARGARVVGLDLSAGMLAHAAGLVAGPLVRGDMLRLPFADASFTGVWSIASLLHLPYAVAPRAVAEIGRVLRPGGVLALSVQAGDGEAWEAGPYPEAGERFFARYSLAGVRKLVSGAGLAVGDSRAIRHGDGRGWLQVLAVRPAPRPPRP